MARPKRCRKICGYPDYWSFSPEGTEVQETIMFKLDEFETIRLIDHRNMTQDECASVMGVSRATVAGIYDSARHKLAEALIEGKRIRITGGTYSIDSIPASAHIKEKGEKDMRIAVTYEQGMIGQHFGRAEQFKLYDIADGEIKYSQIIDTNGTGHGALAGFLRAAEVETLICGGIGPGARYALEDMGIKLLPGVTGAADDVAKAYLEGSLIYDPDTTCHHHDHEGGHDCHHGGGCGNHGCHQ